MSKIFIHHYHLGIKVVPFVPAFLLSMSGALCLASARAAEGSQSSSFSTKSLNEEVAKIIGRDANTPSDSPWFHAWYDKSENNGADLLTGILDFYWYEDGEGNNRLGHAWGFSPPEGSDTFSVAYQNIFSGENTASGIPNQQPNVRYFGYNWTQNTELKKWYNVLDLSLGYDNKQSSFDEKKMAEYDIQVTDGDGGTIEKPNEIKSICNRVYSSYTKSRLILQKAEFTFKDSTFIANSFTGLSDNSRGKDNTAVIIVNSGGKLTLENVNFIANYSEGNSPRGSCIYVGKGGEIESITGNFIGNYITLKEGIKSGPNGGAIFNDVGGKIGKIEGYFMGNHIYSKSGRALGGTIANHGTLSSLQGVFIGNYAGTENDDDPVFSDAEKGLYEDYGRANSGVLRNYSGTSDGKNYTAVLGWSGDNPEDEYDFETDFYKKDDGKYLYQDGKLVYNDEDNPYFHIAIKGTFIGNWAAARGGVLFNNGEIRGIIHGDFIGNYVNSPNGPAQGGAIANDSGYKAGTTNANSTLAVIEGSFIGNYVYSHAEKKFDPIGRYAQGGAIYNRNAIIGNIMANFSHNYAYSTGAGAFGGAIFNVQQKYRLAQDDISVSTIPIGGDITGDNIKNYVATLGSIGADVDHRVSFTANHAKGNTAAAGGAIYLSTNYDQYEYINGESKLVSDTEANKNKASEVHASMEHVYADFTGNYVLSSGDDSMAEGGAIYISDYSAMGNLYGIFEGNYAENSGSGEVSKAKGGALYIGRGANVGTIDAWFKENHAKGNGEVRGGALLVTKGATLGQISDLDEVKKDAQFKATFQGNTAFGQYDEANKKFTGDAAEQHEYLKKNVFGGAIRFDQSFIADLSASFYGNKTNGSGGALSVTPSGFIYQVTGSFENNEAGIYGGAVHNEGTIGFIGEINVKDEAGKESYKKNPTPTELQYAVRNEDGSLSIKSDATEGNNQMGYEEYDGTINGGFVNVSFIGNVVDGVTYNNSKRGLGGAIYTTDNLFIVANDGHNVEFKNNGVYYKGGDNDYVKTKEKGGAVPDGYEKDVKFLNTAIYVDNMGDESTIRTVYLVAEAGSQITIGGAIRGSETTTTGFVLRMRGNTDKDKWHPKESGTIRLDGPVAESYTIMDDVTLQLGQCINYVSYGDVKTLDEYVYYIPQAGETDEQAKSKQAEQAKKYGRSDIFRKSHFSVRSGVVDLTRDIVNQDGSTSGAITQYAFGTMTAYGKSFNYGTNGASDSTVKEIYQDGDLHATWRVDVDLTQKVADLITTFEIRDAEGKIMETKPGSGVYQMSQGGVTLGAIVINNNAYEPDKLLQDQETKNLFNNKVVDNECVVKVQILNLVILNENGEAYTDYTSLTGKDGKTLVNYLENAPIQLDNALNVVDWESAEMNSLDVLAVGVKLGTTRTYHDSLEIVGWRDSLAAWAEMTENTADSRYDDAQWNEGKEWKPESDEKIFTLSGNYYLTRDVEDLKYLKDNTKENTYDGAVYADKWTIKSTSSDNQLNLQEKNLLTKVLENQTTRLQNFTLVKVLGNKMTNEGKLTLDSMALENALTIDNQKTDDGSLTVTGRMDINNIITTSTTGKQGEMIIENSSRVKDTTQTVINIIGTVQNQNITHRGTPTATIANVEVTEDTPATITNLVTSNPDGTPTEAFRRFKGNSLTMEGGQFNLYDMALNRLSLVDFAMKGGKVYVASAKVDLAERIMGGIDASTASGETGSIRLDKISLTSDGQEKVTHVRFVPEEVGHTVQDNNIRNNTALGPIWEYYVTYNDTSKGGGNGQYTFTRTNRVNPAIQVGAVNEQTALATTLLIHDYAFEHANLYSDAFYEAHRAEAYENRYARVTATKGKEGAPATDCPSTRSKGVTGGLQALWARPYTSSESVPLSGGPKVRMNLYGSLVGADSNVTEHRNGWLSVFTGYLGYVGSDQKWGGSNRSRTNGGLIGATETLYKGRFYSAVTLSAGMASGSANTMYGRESFHTNTMGIAARAGYNIPLDACGKYVLQPSLQLAYTRIATGSYTNAAGVRLESKALQSVQVNPFVKLFMHANRDWTPYAVAGYVWNTGGQSQFSADGDKLPELSIDPYAEYGVGVQKIWRDRYTFYGQVTGRSGGREGYELSAGVRWNW